MAITAVHLLLSYRCTNECDHCFLWGSPKARGTMSLAQVKDILRQAKELGTVEFAYFEGGEPFLNYELLVDGLREAAALGFKRGIVSNCYWARTAEDAIEKLRPIAEIGVDDLSLSSDLFHGDAMMTDEARHGVAAAKQLGIPEGVITIEVPEGCSQYGDKDKGEPIIGGNVRFRGRAIAKLADNVPHLPWETFTECPDEDFANQGRVHIDAYGNVHVCQGLVIGNCWNKPLKDIVAGFNPADHPIIGPLMEGGPAALLKRYSLPHNDGYADACHLCYMARNLLRERFPEHLAPANVYGEL